MRWRKREEREEKNKIIIIIKPISRAPIYRTRWEYRVL